MAIQSSPFRWRTRIRRHLPWFLIDLGLAAKGDDCEAHGGHHEWYNAGDSVSACYHCKIEKPGQLWTLGDAVSNEHQESTGSSRS